MSAKLHEIENRLFDKGETKATDRKDLEYQIWLNQSKLDFYTKNPLYTGEKRREHLEGYHRNAVKAHACLAQLQELQKQSHGHPCIDTVAK